MPGTKLETTVRDHFHSLNPDASYGVPVLPAIVAFLRMFVEDEDDLLLASHVDRGAQVGQLLGFSEQHVFLLRFRSPTVNEEAELHVDGTVLPLSALRSLRFVEPSDAQLSGFATASARPVVEVMIDSVDQPVVVGGRDGMQFLAPYSERAQADWRRLFALLGRP